MRASNDLNSGKSSPNIEYQVMGAHMLHGRQAIRAGCDGCTLVFQNALCNLQIDVAIIGHQHAFGADVEDLDDTLRVGGNLEKLALLKIARCKASASRSVLLLRVSRAFSGMAVAGFRIDVASVFMDAANL